MMHFHRIGIEPGDEPLGQSPRRVRSPPINPPASGILPSTRTNDAPAILHDAFMAVPSCPVCERSTTRVLMVTENGDE